MSFEFNSKIQSLTSKLHGLQQSSKKELDLEEVKGQLRKLSENIQKELAQAEKRIYKIENRLEKCQDYSKRSSRAIENVWNDREEKVTEIIGGWVQQYEEKAEQARNLLIREEMNYKMKLQEEQEVITKEMRMEQNRVKDLIHILDREMNKLVTIKAQSHAAIMKEISSAKQTLNEEISNSDQLRENKIRQIQLKIGRMKQKIKTRCNLLSEDMNSKSSKLKQVMKLLLQID